MHSLALLLAAFPLLAEPSHEQANPVYRELRDMGLAIDATNKATLPAPSMPDGLDAAGQREALKGVAGQDYSVEELLRASVVAPQILRIRNIEPSDPRAPARGVDIWFVAHGDLDAFSNRDFQQRVFRPGEEGEEARQLTQADLKKRDITIADEEKENYGRVVFLFLDRVEISATGRSFWTRTPDSILIAGRFDPRFTGDPDFPNLWRPIRKVGQRIERGDASPYDTGAYYIKVTRLAQPEGALFIEAHVVFTEPVGWFDGANLLRSKLPPVVQHNVRNLRRELLRASAEKR